MSKYIRINHPGDGEWVMSRVGGVFNEKTDHVIAVAREDVPLGGVVFTGYLIGSITMHMAGTGNNWGTRDFLWMVYNYAFEQLGVRKVIGLVAADNHLAIAIDLKMGFTIETAISDMTADGGDLLVLSMRKQDCRWLKLRPKHYRSGGVLVDQEVT
jgi:hypothetical protein